MRIIVGQVRSELNPHNGAVQIHLIYDAHSKLDKQRAEAIHSQIMDRVHSTSLEMMQNQSTWNRTFTDCDLVVMFPIGEDGNRLRRIFMDFVETLPQPLEIHPLPNQRPTPTNLRRQGAFYIDEEGHRVPPLFRSIV